MEGRMSLKTATPLALELITQLPTGPARPTSLLFVHGAWHGAWCWERFMPYFVGLGYACYALSLRGHGASDGRPGIRWYGVADYVADLEAAVAALPTPPVIIGHSMGAYTTQIYLERHRPPAAVFLAPMPVMGIAGWLARYARRHPGPFLRNALTLNPYHIVGTPALACANFFSPDLPAADLARHVARLQPESVRIVLDSIILRRPRPRPGVPMLTLAAANDRVFSLAEVTATARAWHSELEVLPDLAHDIMLDTRWELAAARVAGWLQNMVGRDCQQSWQSRPTI
jgi:pimeloyl-ACP methyl ester carboxylesterase